MTLDSTFCEWRVKRTESPDTGRLSVPYPALETRPLHPGRGQANLNRAEFPSGLIIEVLLQGSSIVRPSERQHEENTSLLGTEVVRQYAADRLQGKCAPFRGTQRKYATSRNASADDNRDAARACFLNRVKHQSRYVAKPKAGITS